MTKNKYLIIVQLHAPLKPKKTQKLGRVNLPLLQSSLHFTTGLMPDDAGSNYTQFSDKCFTMPGVIFEVEVEEDKTQQQYIGRYTRQSYYVKMSEKLRHCFLASSKKSQIGRRRLEWRQELQCYKCDQILLKFFNIFFLYLRTFQKV